MLCCPEERDWSDVQLQLWQVLLEFVVVIVKPLDQSVLAAAVNAWELFVDEASSENPKRADVLAHDLAWWTVEECLEEVFSTTPRAFEPD